MTLGANVRFYACQTSDRTYTAYYARALSTHPVLPLALTTPSDWSEEDHLQQLVALHDRCARAWSAFSSQDIRLHNLKLSLMLQ